MAVSFTLTISNLNRFTFKSEIVKFIKWKTFKTFNFIIALLYGIFFFLCGIYFGKLNIIILTIFSLYSTGLFFSTQNVPIITFLTLIRVYFISFTFFNFTPRLTTLLIFQVKVSLTLSTFWFIFSTIINFTTLNLLNGKTRVWLLKVVFIFTLNTLRNWRINFTILNYRIRILDAFLIRGQIIPFNALQTSIGIF